MAKETVKEIGRPAKYKEKTTTIAFRVPISKVEQIKSIVKTLLKKWQK